MKDFFMRPTGDERQAQGVPKCFRCREGYLVRQRLDEVQKALRAWHEYFDRNEKHADAALRALDAAEKWSRMWS